MNGLQKWLVRIKSEGELHTVTCYAKTEEEAKILGERIAMRLLKDPALEIRWVKRYPV